MSTPVVLASTVVPTADARLLSTYTLADGATITGGSRSGTRRSGRRARGRSTFSFVLDLAAPTRSGAFTSIDGGLITCRRPCSTTCRPGRHGAQIDGAGRPERPRRLEPARCRSPATATTAPASAAGFSVMYSTTAGAAWVDSRTSPCQQRLALGGKIGAFVAFGGKLYASDASAGKVYSSLERGLVDEPSPAGATTPRSVRGLQRQALRRATRRRARSSRPPTATPGPRPTAARARLGLRRRSAASRSS